MSLLWSNEPSRGKRLSFNPRPKIPVTGWTPCNNFPSLAGAKAIAVDVETYDPGIKEYGSGWGSGRGHIIGISLATDDGFNKYFPMRHREGFNHDPQQIIRYVREQLSRPHQPKVCHNAIYDVGYLEHEGMPVVGQLFCTWTAEKLIDHSASASLEETAQRYLGTGKSSSVLYEWAWQAWGRGQAKSEAEKRALTMQHLSMIPAELVGAYAESDTTLPLEILPKQFERMDELGLLDVFYMECDLIKLLVQMRLKGVSVDLDAAERAYTDFGVAIQEVQREVDRVAGRPTNTGSPGDVAKIFDKLRIAYPRTEKTNAPSFKGEFLKTIQHPVAAKILELEELKKFQSTFIKGQILDAHINSKVYCTFNPLRAVTGRFSCVTGETPILTQRGNIPMDDLQIGDFVWTHEERWKPVTAKWVAGVEDTFRLKFSDGCFLSCTKDHRLLTSSGEWTTVAELIHHHVNLHQTRRGPGENCQRAENVPRSENSNDSGHCEGCRDLCSEHLLHLEAQCREGGIQSSESHALFRYKDGRPEPDEGQIGRKSPFVEGGLRRSQRILNAQGGRKTLLRSSYCNGQGTWNAPIGTSSQPCCASHRRESSQQQSGQLGTLHEIGPQGDSHSSIKGFPCVELTEIHIGECVEVYDITVLDDASYFACGVFSHNCSSPNLQQTPSRSELSKPVKKAFRPDEGHVEWRDYDYSSIESRLLAHFAVGVGSKALRKEYRDNPDTDYHTYTQAMIKRLVGLELNRKHVKNVNFAGIYGASEKKLQRMMGLTDEEAETFFSAYHAGLPYVKSTMKHMMDVAEEQGYITTVLGRRSVFNHWEPRWTSKGSSRAVPLIFDQAIRFYGPDIKRSNLHKSLNYLLQGSAADLIKKGMVQCFNDGIFDVTGVPRLTIHDALEFSVAETTPAVESAFREMRRIMENAIKFKIPIKLEGHKGPSWGEVPTLIVD